MHAVVQRVADSRAARPREAERPDGWWRRRWLAALGAAAFVLTLDALVRDPGWLDHRVQESLSEASFPAADAVARLFWGVVSWPWAWATIAVPFLASVVARRWLPALALAAVPAGAGAAWLAASLAGRAGPRGDDTFPSPTVVTAVLLGGVLFRTLGAAGRQARLLRAEAAVFAALVGPAGVWLGNVWLTDALGAYAFGGLLLAGLLAAYGRIDRHCGDVPFIHAAHIPHDESRPHAHALTSTILFHGPTVAKIYAPGFVPRALYWLAFQAPFAYCSNRDALEAAVLRRNLAGMLTEYWYGSNRVARALGIEEVDARPAIVSAFVDGREPRDHRAAHAFLNDLANRFDEVGLPTWQVDPRQPRSLGNILETADGYTIIDLESGLVSPLASPRAWWRGLRRGLVPLYDDVFFDLTRAYIEREAARMRAARGDAWLAELRDLLDRAEAATARWHASEPRIPSRIVRGIQTGFGVRGWPARWRARVCAGQAHVEAWLGTAIAAWRAEGRIDAVEDARLRRNVAEPTFLAVLPHIAVHVAIWSVLRFPFGALTRAAYTTTQLLIANGLFLLRKIDRATWCERVGIHSPIVILFTLLPAIGTFAYLLSRPVRANRLLLRVTLDAVLLKVPFRLYERTRLRRLVARPAGSRAPIQAREAADV